MPSKSKYFNRVSDEILAKQLKASGAVLIEGPKWCGKTSTGINAAKSILFLQDPDKKDLYMQTVKTLPSRLLVGDVPRMIDEWQEAPTLWDAVRFEVDKRGKRGQFILTGSSVPRDDESISHTGTGRISRIKMRPMSLYESKESTGEVSLKSLFDGNLDIEGESKLTIPQLAEIICRGGWPDAVVNGDENYLVSKNYTDAVISLDVSRVRGVAPNPERVRKLLRSYARNISTLAAISTIQGDVSQNEGNLQSTALYDYINALKRIFLIEDVPAWQPSLRSKTAIRSGEKRQFVDPSIATAVMNADPDKVLDDLNYMGFLFESLCTRDIRVYSEPLAGYVKYYRDRNGLEADIIIELADGRWAPIEVKLGSADIDSGAQNLIRLRNKVNSEKMGQPSFMMVLTGTPYAYKREDGVLVVPLGCLKP